MFVTRCARAAAGARGPANVRPARHSNVALSVWSTAISTKGETVVTVCLCSCINKKLQIVVEVSQSLVCLHQLFIVKSFMDGFISLLSWVIKQL